MRGCRHAQWFLSLALLILSTGGCNLIHPPVSVLIRDAETKEPIPNAVVTVRPLNDETPNAQRPHATTGPDGIARISAHRPDETLVMVGVTVDGYLPGESSLKDAARLVAKLPVNGVIEVYARPRPVVTLILPTNYPGLVKVEIQIDAISQTPPGQREFEVRVPESGTVTLTGPPILRRGLGPEFRARVSDGRTLPLEPKDDEVGLRWMQSNASEVYFWVGTKAGWAKARSELPQPPQSPQPTVQPPAGGIFSSPGQVWSGGHWGK